ncbi:hypothetical protein ERO13_D12G181550v2 [Gossypium hirsutum]|nr:hypothetical protein ERO13_D12G181550v2 [Gossypium hirsutum]
MSLDDVRMNLEVVKYCATVLFLESSLPDIITGNHRVPRYHRVVMSASHLLSSLVQTCTRFLQVQLQKMFQISLAGVGNSEHHPRISLLTHHTGGENIDVSNPVQPDPFNMGLLRNEIKPMPFNQMSP